MTVTFISNYLTHHQIPFCNEMHNRLGDNFKFISTMPMESERKTCCWSVDQEYSYELKSHISIDNEYKAYDLINKSDVVVIGSVSDKYIYNRLKENKLTFRYSERIYKKGRYRALFPRGLYNIILKHTRYNNNRLYILCASAYTCGDFAILGAYKNKCYKWGYFPDFIDYDVPELMRKKDNEIPMLLWCGRLLSWKHCEYTIELAKRLRDDNLKFILNIIGNGEEENNIRYLADKYDLNNVINFLDFMRPNNVREYMEKANIYLFTSDFNEGWGVVLNEAMNSCCAIVTSHAIGSVPYLVENSKNGLIYKNGDIDDLYKKVRFLLDNKSIQYELGQNAYSTIKYKWNANIAAERLILLSCKLLSNDDVYLFNNGILSKDRFLSNNWYKGSE